jgi:hypothetical protein
VRVEFTGLVLRCSLCHAALVILQLDAGRRLISHETNNPRSPACPHQGKHFSLPEFECKEMEDPCPKTES